jgi:hypothetical protein
MVRTDSCEVGDKIEPLGDVRSPEEGDDEDDADEEVGVVLLNATASAEVAAVRGVEGEPAANADAFDLGVFGLCSVMDSLSATVGAASDANADGFRFRPDRRVPSSWSSGCFLLASAICDATAEREVLFRNNALARISFSFGSEVPFDPAARAAALLAAVRSD